ncbi:phage holin family protein [Rothia sp. CCM 9418]|uniref:phage holin family protein n=1 Tax=unclassified Rothia (in: high G+C Gram-positive bacteria) TaxID=2689056 RepID=UPI003AC12463
MTDNGTPISNGAKKKSSSGLKATFSNLKSNVTSTIDATKVVTRLTPKQIKDEVQIAKLELKNKGVAFGKGAAFVVVGVVFGLFLIISLITAGILALGTVMKPVYAALTLALVFLLLLLVFALIGVKKIKKQLPLKPESAIFGLMYDLGVLKHGSQMDSARLKREQEEKAKAKADAKKAAAEEKEKAAADPSTTAVLASAPNEEQLKQRTKQRREHLKSLRDDIQTYSGNVKGQFTGFLDETKSSVVSLPATISETGNRLAKNASDPDVLKARGGSFALLIGAVGVFFIFLKKLLRRNS